VPSFSGRSYLVLSAFAGLRSNIISLSFRTAAREGLILFMSTSVCQNVSKDFISLRLNNGRLTYSYNLGNEAVDITSNVTVNNNSWVNVELTRNGASGELYVEGELVGLGSAVQNQFVELNVEGRVYLGGVPDSVFCQLPSDQLKIGFVGCIRGVIIESVELDLVDKATDGINIESCMTTQCSSHSDCQNGGTCLTTLFSSVCLCPYGYLGDNCEHDLRPLNIESYSGNSYSVWKLQPDALRNNFVVTLSVRPTSHNSTGLLLFINSKGDYFSLFISNGYLTVHLHVGSDAVGVTTSSQPVVPGDFTSVSVEKNKNTVELIVDGHHFTNGTATGNYTLLNVGDELFVGGVNSSNQLRDDLPLQGFYGCIADVRLNRDRLSQLQGGVNVRECNYDPCDSNDCSNTSICVPNGLNYVCFDGDECRLTWDVNTQQWQQKPTYSCPTVGTPDPIRFYGQGFVKFPYTNDNTKMTKVQFNITTTEDDGLVLYIPPTKVDYFVVGLNKGLLEVKFDLGAGDDIFTTYQNVAINDGSWHNVVITRLSSDASIVVDGQEVAVQLSSSGEKLSSLNMVSSLYIGGVDSSVGGYAGYGTGLSGCIESVSANGVLYDFKRVVNGDDVSVC
jgi:hypothetical protein